MARSMANVSVDVELPGRALSSEEELLAEDSDHTFSAHASHRRIVAGALGAMALVACGVLAFLSMQPSEEESPTMTLRSLLESPEVHDVSTQNIMKVQMRMLGQSGTHEGIRKVVADKFVSVSRSLKDTDPDFDRKLDEVKVTKKHHDSVVHMMRYLSDTRVQSVGVDVAHAMRNSRSDHPAVLEDEIVRKLAPRKEELGKLHREMFPANVRELMTRHNDGVHELLLQPNRIRALKTFDDSWSSILMAHDGKDGHKERQLQEFPVINAATTTQAPLATALDVLGIIGAIAQELSVLLRMIKPLAKIMPGSHDIGLNPMATSAIGFLDALFNTVSCELEAAQDNDNPIEMVTCPLMSGSAAFDAMRIVFVKLELLGDNNATDGVQGEHAGAVNPILEEAAASNSITCIFYGNCGATTTTTTLAR